MNSCAYYQELISTLVDGELSDEESEALMLHLNSCSRCNAMYAVFHDLSDILSEEPEPLPEGLHENIMAGVRRSELMKKNRRMRRIGLRTAMTAAACAVLVLFAAAGFGPGKRAESVSIRSAEEAGKVMQTAAPAADYAVSPATPVPVQTFAPAQSPAPMQTFTPAQTPVSVQTSAPANTDIYYASGSAMTYTPVQPEQYDFYYTEENSYAAWTPAPAQTAVPAPETVYSPVPETAYSPAPETVRTTAPVLTPQDLPEARSAAEEIPAAAETESAAEVPDISASLMQAPEAPQDTVSTAEEAYIPAESEQESTDETETAEAPAAFSFFSSMINMFDAAPSEELAESKQAAAPAAMDAALDDFSADGAGESPAPVLSSIPLEITTNERIADAVPTPSVSEEHVNVYGSDARSRLLAMIGNKEDSLPQEAELTRLVHVSFVPEDAYGSEETMDISIYGDFVYCSLHPVEGGNVTYRADCSLKELDSFLAACMATPAPSAAPTPDPYTTETPAQTSEQPIPETPVPTMNEASAEKTPEE